MGVNIPYSNIAREEPSAGCPCESHKNTEASKYSLLSKLKTKEVFDKIGDFICQVNSSTSISTGILLNNTEVIVTTHSVALQKFLNEISDNLQTECKENRYQYYKATTGEGLLDIYDPNIEIVYKGQVYKAKSNQFFIGPYEYFYDIARIQLESPILSMVPELQFTLKIKEVQPGRKVYFAGHALGKKEASFHKGLVCSVNHNNNISTFNIDGSVMPGSSGSPVFVQDKQQIYLAGVITSTIADIDPILSKNIESIQESQGAIITDANGINLIEVFKKTSLALLNNFSVGIGKAVDSYHIHNYTEHSLNLANLPFSTDLLIKKGQQRSRPAKKTSGPIKKIWFKEREIEDKGYLLTPPGEQEHIYIDSHQGKHLGGWFGPFKSRTGGTQLPYTFEEVVILAYFIIDHEEFKSKMSKLRGAYDPSKASTMTEKVEIDSSKDDIIKFVNSMKILSDEEFRKRIAGTKDAVIPILHNLLKRVTDSKFRLDLCYGPKNPDVKHNDFKIKEWSFHFFEEKG